MQTMQLKQTIYVQCTSIGNDYEEISWFSKIQINDKNGNYAT